jgi:hypothetical protein
MAFVTALGLFAYFGLVGHPLVAVLHTRRDLVRNALLAPAAGAAVTIYAAYAASRLGLPLGLCARPLAGAVLLGAGLAWWRRPPLLPQRLWAYLAAMAVAFAAVGWPLLAPGTAWLGSFNPDFANYVLGAERLIGEGYLHRPDPGVWQRQSDWSAYFVAFAAVGARNGAELLLAWTASVLGRAAADVYMPLIVALHVALLAAAAALIGTPYRRARLAAAALLAVSSMLGIGVVLGLLAQVAGLALLALACNLWLSPFQRLEASALRRWVVLTGLVSAAFALTYPEAVPFLALALLVHNATAPSRLRARGLTAAKAASAAVLVAGALVTPELVGTVGYILRQATQSVGSMQHQELFPYFLLPSGLAALFGLIPYLPPDNILVSAAILLGGLLLGGTLAATLWQVRQREPAAAVATAMSLMVPVLFAHGAGFGLFKLAMYIQPFLIPTTVLALCRALRTAR